MNETIQLTPCMYSSESMESLSREGLSKIKDHAIKGVDNRKTKTSGRERPRSLSNNKYQYLEKFIFHASRSYPYPENSGEHRPRNDEQSTETGTRATRLHISPKETVIRTFRVSKAVGSVVNSDCTFGKIKIIQLNRE